MNCHDLWLRIRALTLRNRVEQELEDELDFHIEMQTRKNLAAGMSDSEARRRARIEFGGVTRVEEECRDARRVNLIETLWQDIRYAIRGFRRSPTFVITVVGTIALGLGLNTTLFSVFNAYVLRPAPVRDPYALFDFFWANRASRGHSFQWPEYEEFRTHNPAFSETFAYQYMQARVDGRNMFGQLVTGNYFRMLGVNPVLGRTLLPEDSSAPGREPVVVLSYMAWENRYASDPEIVGKRLIIRGYPVQVIGVAPAGFTGLGELMLDFWAPVTLSAQFQARPEVGVVGRLNRGLSVRQAKAGLALWAQRFTSGYPDVEKATTIHFQPRATSIPLSPNIVLISSPILVAFALVLLIACANVANMILARAMSRQREIGIRLSLGAARSRLIRQLLTESVLLALPAAAAGFVVSQATIELGTRAMFATIPAEFSDFIRVAPMSPDTRVFGFMLAAAVLSALLFGLAPALQATRSERHASVPRRFH